MNILLQINHINVRSQLTYAVECMIKIDFPDNWPDLIIEIKNFIDSDDEMMILTALEILKPICRIYEFEYKIKRKQLEEIVDNIFPRLEEIISQIEQNTSVKAFDIKYRIADLLYIVNQISMCKRYRDKEGFERLIEFYKFAIESIWTISKFENSDKSLTEPTENTDEIAYRKSRPEWKFNTVAMHFMFRLIQKYGNPSLCEEDDKELSVFICKYIYHCNENI